MAILKNLPGTQHTMNRITVAILISVIAALFVAGSGCIYTTGGQNGTQNASHVNIRIPLLPNLFGNATNGLKAITSRLSPAVCGKSAQREW